MPWHQNTGLQKNYTKTSCWLGALFGILFYAKESTGCTGSTCYKSVFSLDATAFNSCLHCFFSFPFLTFLLFSVFICQELKTVHTRRVPKKRRKYPKSILNPQTAKPPNHHIMCLKQTSPLYMNIITETSRTEIRTNTVRQGSQRLGQR